MSNSIFKCILVSLLPLTTQGQSTILLKQIEQPSTGGQVLQSNSSGSPLWRSLGNAVGNIVTTDANGQFNYRTPTQTLSDIGAAPSVHTHDASDITSGVLSVNRIPILDYVALTGNQTVSGVKTWNDRQSYKGLRSQEYNLSGTSATVFRKVENVAHYANSGAVVGSIQIKLPITTSTMWSMRVFIYQYSPTGSRYPLEMIITGFTLNNQQRTVWCSAPDLISQVRWGRNVANNATYILIDAMAGGWSYPKVEVKEVYYSNSGTTSSTLIDASNYSVTISTDETDYVHNGTVTNVDFIKDSRYALASSLTGYLPLTGGTLTGSLSLGTASNATGDFVTRNSSTGSLGVRTAAQVRTDIGAAATTHSHTIADVTGLQTALDGYEETTNKAQDFTTVNQDLYPSTQAVVDYINDEKDVAQWNANKLQGTDMFLGTPSNGQVLIYDGGWKNIAPPWITGNQTIVLSGDVIGSGATSISTTIANNAVTTTKIANSNVTLAKIQDIASQRLLGNPTGSSTAPSEIALGEGIEFDASTQALTTGFMFGTTANSNTLIKRNSSTIFGADVHYMDRSEMGAAYSVNPNPQDCYVITDQDERLVYTKEGTWKIAMPDPSDYPNRTLKFTLLYRDITVILADNSCDVGNVVVNVTDGTATFSYLQPGNLSTDTSEEDRLYTWIEVQSILFDGNYYWTLVEWGN